MKMCRLQSSFIGLLLVLATGAPAVLADVVDNSNFSENAWLAEGNVRCSDYFSNDLVKEIGTSSVLHVGDVPEGDPLSETLSGSFNPLDDPNAPTYMDDETVTYTVTDTDASGNPLELSFTSSTPINAVIVKLSRMVNFYSLVSGGVTSDSRIDLDDGDPANPNDMEISAVSFCYGMPGDTTVPDLPVCDGIDEENCQEGEAFECNVIGGALQCCACNVAEPIQGCLLGVPGSCPPSLSLQPAATGIGSDIVCVPGKFGLVCYFIK